MGACGGLGVIAFAGGGVGDAIRVGVRLGIGDSISR